MDDYISRQAAINEIKIRQHSAYEWYTTAKSKDDEEIMVRADSAHASFIECILTLKKLPSADVVEVVRCKECIHSYVFEPWEGTNAIRYCKTLKNHCGDSDMWVEDNDYCSYGEEK